MTLALFLLFSCADYDVQTWSSPLASLADQPGDASRGQQLFFSEDWQDDSTYVYTCASCHSVDPADTLSNDSDSLVRAGHSVWNAPWRQRWKNSYDWDSEFNEVIGAYGGQICVTAYFPSPSALSPQQAADLEAWMRTQKDATPTGELSRPLDFSFTRWSTQSTFVANAKNGDTWLRGAALGDVAAGTDLIEPYCGSCHWGTGVVRFYALSNQSTGQLISRIRRVNVDGVDAPNWRMPRLPHDRLSDADLADILAALTQD